VSVFRESRVRLLNARRRNVRMGHVDQERRNEKDSFIYVWSVRFVRERNAFDCASEASADAHCGIPVR